MILLFFQVKPLVITSKNITGDKPPVVDFIMKQELVYRDGTNVMGKSFIQRQVQNVTILIH